MSVLENIAGFFVGSLAVVAIIILLSPWAFLALEWLGRTVNSYVKWCFKGRA